MVFFYAWKLSVGVLIAGAGSGWWSWHWSFWLFFGPDLAGLLRVVIALYEGRDRRRAAEDAWRHGDDRGGPAAAAKSGPRPAACLIDDDSGVPRPVCAEYPRCPCSRPDFGATCLIAHGDGFHPRCREYPRCVCGGPGGNSTPT
jgi:hypothetical protein